MSKTSQSTLLIKRYPYLAAEWHPSKNKGLKLESVTTGMGKKVWWKCENGHEWQQEVCRRTYYPNCPACKKEYKRKIKDARYLFDHPSGWLTLSCGKGYEIKFNLTAKKYILLRNKKKLFSNGNFALVLKYSRKHGVDKEFLPKNRADWYDWK